MVLEGGVEVTSMVMRNNCVTSFAFSSRLQGKSVSLYDVF